MFEPVQIESLDFRTRCQIRRMEDLTGQTTAEVIRTAVDLYFQQVMATATDEELAAARKQVEYGRAEDERLRRLRAEGKQV